MSLRHVADRSYPSHSLEDVLTSGLKSILFHCKISGDDLKKIASCIVDHHFQKDCVIGVLNAEDGSIIKDICPEIRILAFMPELEQLESFLESETEIIRLWEAWVMEERVKKVRDSGKQLWVMAGKCTPEGVGYTSAESMRYWMDLGVDGILVNDIRWAETIIKE